MKVNIEIEPQDYLNAIRPFKNGCSFRALFKSDGQMLLEPGCYLLVNLLSDVEKSLLERWKGNGEKPFLVEVTSDVANQAKLMPPCKWCNGRYI